MPTEFGERVLASVNKPADPLTIDGMPAEEFGAQERAADAQGGTLQYNDDGTPYDPDNEGKVLFGEPSEQPPLFPVNPLQQVSNNYVWNKGHEDAVLNGDLSSTTQRADAYREDQSVTDELVEFMHVQYNDETLLNYGALEGLEGLPPEEQIARITSEYNRLDAKKLSSKNQLLIQMLRDGMGDMPAKAAQEVWMTLPVKTLQALGKQQERQQKDRLRIEIDSIAAEVGETFTILSGTGEAIQQDFIPVLGALTRVLTTKEFLPEGVEIGAFRGILPGELRQEAREWWVGATNEQRHQYISDVKEAYETLRKGPHSYLFTDYAFIENLMGVFTEGLLEENIAKDSLDRWVGNLDVLLESVYAVGLVAKRGKSITSLFRANNASSVRQAARAAGNTSAAAGIDNQIRAAASQFDITPAEASIVDLPRPASFRDEMDVLPDGVKEVLHENDALRTQMLSNTSDLNQQGLTQTDKDNAVAKAISELDWGDASHVNHRMTTVQDLPGGDGVRITAVLGETPTGGWKTFDGLADELVDLDPMLDTFEIVRRGPKGTIEALGVTPDEFAKFVTKGEVPVTVESGLAPDSATSRLFGGRRLTKVPDEELRQALPDAPITDAENIMRELDRRVQGLDEDPLRALDGDEFYLRMTQDKFWHSLDKEGFNQESFLNTGALPRGIVAPNGKFGDDIFGAFDHTYRQGQGLDRDFDRIYSDFYKLNAEDKLVVQNLFEWTEDFAKKQADTGLGRSPTYEELITEFDGLTIPQLRGYAAVRDGLDVQYELFNRRLYREWHTQGYKTARAHDPNLPNYHGTSMERADAKAGVYFDPVANELKTLDSADVDDIFNAGGSTIKLEFPIDAPKGGKFDRVLVRSGEYEIGDLSRSPLNYFEGYNMRFYEDPVYIIKNTRGISVNGVATDQVVTEALRTAGSSPEAQRYINKYANKVQDDLGRFVDRKNPNITYEVKPAKNISQTEGTLYQRQALQREGRMFWDKRNLERLPDVNGNRARIQDLGRALEQGTAMATRQITQEELMTTLKNAFGNQYNDLVSTQDLASKDIKTIIAQLRADRANVTNTLLRKRYNDAIELAKYLRVQLGTDSAVVPFLRERTIAVANWIANLGVRGDIDSLKKFGGWAERRGQMLDPFRFARSVAFHTFMVFRPVRQLLLQSSQITYLMPLDPTYIGTGKVFIDSFALRRGIKKMTTAKYVDGWQDSHFAKQMGVSKKEYKRIVEEFHRSGLLETVDVNAFNPTANRARNIPLEDTRLSRGWYRFRGFTQRSKQVFQNGFDIGERNNVTFTYMLALRRAEKKYGVKDLTKFSRQQWDEIAKDTTNLALGMTRPNKFGYQSGMSGMAMQFLSFSHKAALGLMGGNPALKGKGLKILMSGYLLWGANIFGAEDKARELLAQMGLSGKADAEIIPGIRLSDLMAAGLIESGLNAILTATTEAEKELDIGFMAPGANVISLWESWFEAIAEAPEKGLMGPFHNPASGFLQGLDFGYNLVKHSDRPPVEKLMKFGDAITRFTFTGYNDANRAYFAYTTGKWLSKSGDVLETKPVMSAILARLFLGVRTEEELSSYNVRTLVWEDQDNVKNAVDSNKRFLKELFGGYQGKEYGPEYVNEMLGVLNSMYEEWPEGLRREIFVRSLTEGTESAPSIMEQIGKMVELGGSTNLKAIIPWIETQADIPPQQKAWLVEYVNEQQNQFNQMDEAHLQMQQKDRKAN